MLYHVDGRTKVVAGCARHGVYVESCEVLGHGALCTWRLDSPLVARGEERTEEEAPLHSPAQPQPVVCPTQAKEDADRPVSGLVLEPVESWE